LKRPRKLALDAQRVRQLLTQFGYNVSPYSDGELLGAIGRGFANMRSLFGAEAARDAYETLSTHTRQNPEIGTAATATIPRIDMKS
jgi:hypothetical protein